MSPLRELNAALDEILKLTDPARRNQVRAWLRVVVASAKMLPSEWSLGLMDRKVEEANRDSAIDRSGPGSPPGQV